jgi:hypothetical protein
MMIKIFIYFLFIFSIYSETLQYYGEAVDLKTNLKIYNDHYTETIENGKLVNSIVEYRNLSGKIIAKKTINFKKNKNFPDFKHEIFTDGYIEGGELVGNKYKLFHRKNKNSEMEEKLIDIKNNSTSDDGLNEFIKDNLDVFVKDEKMNFTFYIPYQLDYFSFTVKKTRIARFDDKRAISLKVEIDNSFLKNFINPSYMVYDLDTKRIIYYEGVSNINNENGRSYFIRHTYFYD